ncbi:MAG TPA: tripartite tricarboxylate transporter substrate-binding protein [Paenalcaligenes sp.]|nr:tripartite tricarboxylate transporter substrate-binding protein [Paenalcaligenes sp.]
MWAPKGTPKPIVEKLANYAQEALQEPNIIEQYKSIGAIPVGSEPEDFVEYSELESEK